ncbi:MAG: phage protein GemA/Gp16 family protein [Balneola sp.]
MKPIVKWQIQSIHTIRRAMWGDDRSNYENLLANFYGASSCKDLNYNEANDLIDRLKATQKGEPMPPIRRGRIWANMGQVRKIEALSSLLDWDEWAENKFIKRQTKRNSTRWMLTIASATKVIIGQQKILANGNTETYNWLNRATPEMINSEQGKAIKKALRN